MSKRLFDLLFTIPGLILLSPLLLALALWIKIDSPGPVFYRQERIGRHGQPFRIFKFRTMHIDADKQGLLTVGSDQRVTRAGRFLRKSKLDELPQLIDVVRGTMSLVGPRPEVAKFVAAYPAPIRSKVLSLRPGITDWASIRMIDENELLGQATDPERCYIEQILPQKLNYYVQYADQHSIAGDLYIILATFRKIITR